jgi:putative phosphoribosyl transferase
MHSFMTDDRELVEISTDDAKLSGILSLPATTVGLVLFAHGSGSGRFSSRNQYVASILNQAGLGTLLFDLLSEKESLDRAKVFDVSLLAERLQAATVWATHQEEIGLLPIGYFGASTGAAAALIAAATEADPVRAVVSRGGRPDLAGNRLSRVVAPTLLIVGGSDQPVLELNRRAFAALNCKKQLTVVPGATHLFAEPGALQEVAELASAWFQKYLAHK